MMNRQYLILGGSRGLGQSFTQLVFSHDKTAALDIVSRNQPPFFQSNDKIRWIQGDLTKKMDQEKILSISSKYTDIIYFAGGGPYGYYQKHHWQSHVWTFELNFLFPSRLLHFLLPLKTWNKLVFIGSSIAENQPDPFGASYAASKHALKGLITSIQAESFDFQERLYLFSPGYMDTRLLPINAWPRGEKGLVESPDEVAKKLYFFLQS